MVVFCGVARKVRRFLAHVPAIQGVTGASISNDRREAGDITRLALWEKYETIFSIRMTDEQRYPPNRTPIPNSLS